MKKVLSLLMIFVFLNASSWAFPPVFPTSAANITGTYAGVLLPTSAAETGSASAASIGIFGIGIPASSSGTPFVQGAGIVFIGGAGYNMTVTGVFDPKSSQVSAILQGSFSFTVQTGGTDTTTGTATTTTSTLTSFAEGSMVATVAAPSMGNSNSALTGGGAADTATAERLTGSASLDLFANVGASGADVTSTASFTVNGFQQSATYMVPTLQNASLAATP
jgi:hypothetical protein